MFCPKRDDLKAKIKKAGLKYYDIAAVLSINAGLVSKKINGFCSLSRAEEKAILRLCENSEKGKNNGN